MRNPYSHPCYDSYNRTMSLLCSTAVAYPEETPTPGVTPYTETPTPGDTPLFTSNENETPTPGVTPLALPEEASESESDSDCDSDVCEIVRSGFETDFASPIMVCNFLSHRIRRGKAHITQTSTGGHGQKERKNSFPPALLYSDFGWQSLFSKG